MTIAVPPEGESLRRVGNFSYWVEHAHIASIAWHGQEIIRRLFVTVRDRNWRETPATEWHAQLLAGDEGVALKAVHRSALVEFEWEGTLTIRENKLTFSINGKVLRDMEVCRIGAVVLYPVGLFLGSRIEVLGPQGTHSLDIREQLYPQPIVADLPSGMTAPFSSLSVSFADRNTLECRFSGDLFELEDQRNWGDASFKAYCTPLSRGFPRRVTNGTNVRQQVEVVLAMQTQSAGVGLPIVHEIGRIAAIGQRSFRFPPVGIVSTAEPHDALWPHIRVDLPNPEGYPNLLRTLEGLAPTAALELCLTLDKSGLIVRSLEALLKRVNSRIVRILLRGPGTDIPCERSIAQLCASLKSLDIRTGPVFTATDGYFVELNRDKPIPQLDGVAFPFASTVHLSDTRTIAESPAVLADMVTSARKLSGRSTVAISPLALFHPPALTSCPFPNSLVVPWFLAMLLAGAKSELSSITLAADLIDALSAEKNELVFHCVRRWSERPVLPLAHREPEDVYAGYVDNGSDPAEIILVNLRRTPIDVFWRDEELRFIRTLDASTGLPTSFKETDLRLPPASAIIATMA